MKEEIPEKRRKEKEIIRNYPVAFRGDLLHHISPKSITKHGYLGYNFITV
jgi:hypothetical protein